MAMLDLGKLGFDLVLNKAGWNKDFKEADNDIETHQSKWSGMADKIGGGIKLGIVGAVTGIAVAVSGMAVAGGQAAIELQDHMAKIQSATNMSAEDTEKTKKTIQDLYKTNEDSYEDLAKTVTAMSNNMGMGAEDIKKYAQNYLDYAKVTGQANEEAVGAIDDLGDSWGLTADESVAAMDKLLVLNQEYGMSVTDAQASLTKMAPAAKAVGMSMDEASAYMAMFAQTGVDAGTASTAFSKALQNVKSPDELRNMISNIQNTDDAFERARLSSELFGAKAGPQMAQALGESDLSIDKFIENMNLTGGAVTKASADYDKSFKVQLELMKKQFSGLFEELAEKLLPILNRMMEWVMANMPQIQAVLTTVFNVVGDIIGNFVTIIQDVINVFVDWFQGNKETTDQYMAMFNMFKDWFIHIFNELKDIVMITLEIIMELWNKYGNDILAIVKPIFMALLTFIDYIVNQIKTIISIVLDLITGDWEGAWDGIKQLFVNAWQAMSDILPNLLEAIFAILSGAFGIFKDLGSGMFNMVWEGLKDVWSNISSWVSDKVSWLADKLMFWKKSNNEMATDNGNGLRVEGSYAVGTTYVPKNMIAEIHEGEAIIPKNQNPYAGGTGLGGINNSFVIQNMTVRNDSDINLIARELYGLQKNSMRGVGIA